MMTLMTVMHAMAQDIVQLAGAYQVQVMMIAKSVLVKVSV